MSVITTIALQSVHRPSKGEIEAVLDSMIASAEHLGFAPLRAQAIFSPSVGDVLEASRVVNDGAMQAKWERKT